MQDGRVMALRGAMNVLLFDAEACTSHQRAGADAVRGHANAGRSGTRKRRAGRERARGVRLVVGRRTTATARGRPAGVDHPADVLGSAYVEVFRYREDSDDTYDRVAVAVLVAVVLGAGASGVMNEPPRRAVTCTDVSAVVRLYPRAGTWKACWGNTLHGLPDGAGGPVVP